MDSIKGRVAFVTGGASGIGLGITHALLGAGAQVVIADLRADHLEAALAALAQRGQAGNVHGIRLDVTDRAAMAAAAEEAERLFGRVHILVNNAGVGIQGPLKGITYEDWDFGLAVNLGGVINGLQTFLPRIRAHGEGGHIVNTSSLSALVPMPAQFAVYTAAKAAVIAISENIRGELAQEHIGVTVLCPGPVRTNIHEVGRNRPERFGAGAAFKAVQEGAVPVPFPAQMEPDQVGELVLDAIRRDQLYVITHGEWRAAAEQRHAAQVAAMPTKLDPALVSWLQSRPAAAAKKD